MLKIPVESTLEVVRCKASASSKTSNMFSIGKDLRPGERSSDDQFAQLFRSIPNLRRILHIYLFFFMLLVGRIEAAGIGCFVCSSFNKSNLECEDTFNSTIAHPSYGTVNNYQYPCWAFRQGRKGLFPADHCVKVSGYQLDNPSQTIVIRTCALDSGSLTADTEIVRISFCGHFKYEGNQYSGCVQSCSTDGCNSSIVPSSTGLPVLVFFSLLGLVALSN